MGSRSWPLTNASPEKYYRNTLDAAAPLTAESLKAGFDRMMAQPAIYMRLPKVRPHEATVRWDGTAWEATFWGERDGCSQQFARRSPTIPRFVPVAGRLALRWMRQVGGGLTARQIALCYAAAEAADNTAKPV